MTKVFCYFVLILVFSSCSTEERPNDVRDIKLKYISFTEAVNNELLPLQLTFGIPENFTVRSSKNPSLGILWGVEDEIKEVIKTQKTRTKSGFFRLFVSVNTAYDVHSKKFSGEDQMVNELKKMGAKNIEFDKKFIGGYPGLVTSADFKGKKLFSCFIATLNSTNVITILYYSPEKFTGGEKALWEKVISSIKRVEYKEKEVSGTNAEEELKKVLQANQFKKFRIDLLTKIDNDKAKKVPRIEQRFSVDHSNGFLSADFERSGNNILKTDTMTTGFPQPWNIPGVSMKILKSGNMISTETTVNGKKLPVRKGKLDDFQKADMSPIQYLTGYPIVTLKTSSEFLNDIFEFFDIKLSNNNKEIVQLVGVPRKSAFLAYMKSNNIPLKYNGAPFVNELMKRFSKILIVLDADSNKLKTLTIYGNMNEHLVSTQIKLSEIK